MEMGKVTLEGSEPYVMPTLQSAEVAYGRRAVTAHLFVLSDGRKPVPIQLPMTPEQALALADKLANAATKSLT